MAPTPTADSFSPDINSYYDPNIPSRASSRTTRTTPLSFVSDASTRVGSLVSPNKTKPPRISIRNQHISQPIGSADLRDAHYYDETVPLSPRVYTPGPPPPTPGKKKQVQVSVEPIDEYEYEHEDELPATQYQSRHSPPQQHQQSFPQYPSEHQFQPLAPPPQQQLPSPPQQQTNPLARNLREKRVPPSLALRSAAANNSMAGIATAHPANAPRSLPFREVYGDASLRSAPPTKTTFLDRPNKMPSGPRTGVVPSTPYSPYMPGTPMTPITPRRLLNKQDLKAKRKEEKLKVLLEDDLVTNDDNMWGG